MNISLEIKISPMVTELENKIINDYWLYENEEFTHTPTLLKEKYEISQPKLVGLVKQHSFCLITKEKCIECKEILKYSVTSQTQFKQRIKSTINRCEVCRSINSDKLKRDREERNISYEQQQGELILINKLPKLSYKHREVLARMVHIDDKRRIFKEVFKGDYEGTWDVVNELQKQGFLDVLRDEDKSVRGFNFINGLKGELAKYLDEEERKESLDNSVRTHLRKKLNKTKPTQPDFIGEIELPKDFHFRKGIEYTCGAWIQKDGSINLKITPREELFKSSRSSNTDPKHIRDILSDDFGLNTDEF